MARPRLIARRRELGLTKEEVAEAIGASVRMIYAYETGASTPRQGRRLKLADTYDWSLAQLTAALGTATVNGHDVPTWLTLYASLEQSASLVCAWQPYTVHALLQTFDYAHAVESTGPADMGADAIAHRVELRLGRQTALHRPDPLQLHVVLDESVLLRRTGDRAVMAAQLDHLVDAMRLPNVDIRVLPLDAGTHAAAFGAFTTLTRPGDTGPFMVCVEDRTGHRYLEDYDSVDAHARLFEHLVDQSLDTDATRDLIAARSKDYL